MKAVVKEERNATKVKDEGEAGQHNRRGHRCGARRYNNAAGGGSSGNTPTAKYPTRNKDLPENLVLTTRDIMMLPISTHTQGFGDFFAHDVQRRGRLYYPQDASRYYPHRRRTHGTEGLFRTRPSSNFLGDL